MNLSEDKISQFKEYITDCQNVVLFVHHNPDGDALGSSCALRSLLVSLKKTVAIVAPSECPQYLSFIEGISDVVDFSANKDAALKIIADADLAVMLDFNRKDRLGDAMSSKVDLTGKKTILIDHHPEPDNFADLLFSFTTVSSTSELLFHILKASNLFSDLSVKGAEALYTGILTDTGGFSHNCSRSDTYLAVADLMDKGVDRELIHDLIFHSSTLSRLQLLGNCIGNRMVVFPEYGVAYITISLEDKLKFNFESGDSEGIVNYPLSVKGINFCALFTENEDMTKVSFRSKGTFPANAFSEKFFNGGGHLNAAGGRTFKKLPEAIQLFETGLHVFSDELKSLL